MPRPCADDLRWRMIYNAKPYCLGRPTGGGALFPHEEYNIMNCKLRTPQIQLHEIENHIINSTGSTFGAETLCRDIWNNA